MSGVRSKPLFILAVVTIGLLCAGTRTQAQSCSVHATLNTG